MTTPVLVLRLQPHRRQAYWRRRVQDGKSKHNFERRNLFLGGFLASKSEADRTRLSVTCMLIKEPSGSRGSRNALLWRCGSLWFASAANERNGKLDRPINHLSKCGSPSLPTVHLIKRPPGNVPNNHRLSTLQATTSREQFHYALRTRESRSPW